MSLETDIAAIIKQEETLKFKSFNEADAWKLGQQMHAAAQSAGHPLLIEIRSGGRQLFVSALPGTSPDNCEWVRRKANTVMRFQKCSYRMGRETDLRGTKIDSARGLDAMDYAKEGGGFPIHILGTGIVGAVIVSGIPQRDDHGFVVEQLAIFLGHDPQSLKLPAE
ncbi:MAG: heme-degrading domain-containing protein [Aestuariivirga sp.]|jgi:uncharacterized protein (UPF0303 family)